MFRTRALRDGPVIDMAEQAPAALSQKSLGPAIADGRIYDAWCHGLPAFKAMCALSVAKAKQSLHGSGRAC